MELLICETVALVLVLCGELDHIQNSYMTCIMHTARIINEIDILAVRRRHVIHQPCIQPSSSQILGSSMVRASNRCTEGHRFNNWTYDLSLQQELFLLETQIFLCPMLVTCWSRLFSLLHVIMLCTKRQKHCYCSPTLPCSTMLP